MYVTFVLVLLNVFGGLSYDIKGFDDTVLYDINWPGSKTDNIDLNAPEYMIVTSSHKEKYKCLLPTVEEKEVNNNEKYSGPSPLQLISPLFTQTSCSYRLESYWTYEVCHGRFIRQYHEDREGKKVKLQEYILGRWDPGYYEMVLKDARDNKGFGKDDVIPLKKIDGINLPYFEIVMDNGTQCDLNQNKPRRTRILYVCYIHGKHEIYSLKETSTCQYEIVVLSPLLCLHPKYKPQETGENQISCLPLEGNTDVPYNMMKMRAESSKLRKKPIVEQIRIEFVPVNLEVKEPETPAYDNPQEAFLKGEYCLYGTEGERFWKYEFCYGKGVEQFHEYKNSRKTSISLGVFKKENHLKWLGENPSKRPAPKGKRDHITQLYTGGTVCDKNGKQRQTEVRLKCLKNASKFEDAKLYLLEPKDCEFILGIESVLICDILDRADDDGLIDVKGNHAEGAGTDEGVVRV